MSSGPSDSNRAQPLIVVLAVGVLITLGLLVGRGLEDSRDAERADTPGLIAPIDEERTDAGETYVPDLPAVPDLARDRATRPTRPEADPATDALAQEMRLVHEARIQLEADPGAALDLLEQHRTRFPEGALAEEREAYAILAMVMTEQPAGEIERRFSDLVADHPGTSFAPAIREAIARRAERDQRETGAPHR